MTVHLPDAAASFYRFLSGDESEFGVHIEYEDLYDSIIFLVCIYVAGQVASRLFRMPSLVGEIVVGILLGPPLANYVPYPEAWVLFGEIGLVLLVLEAGIDVDVSTLRLIGTRGFMIAIVGSLLPIGIGCGLAVAMNVGNYKAVLAAGATFGPTSLGIALNILRGGGILNTPVGQLIISAAVIDDMIALIVLSMLETLTVDITAAAIIIPIISALAFLFLGGFIALKIVPGVVERVILRRTEPEHHGKIELALMFGGLLGMMPATYYAKASYLMGAFITGLAFCTSHELHVQFITQFKRVMQWLMRIFFAASIGFQVPLSDFWNGVVIWQGFVFVIALFGKLIVGFMVPNFTQSRKFTGMHLRDCLITGFSMAAEGEFAFVIAVYSVENGLIGRQLYASVVFAVLLSTIFPPFFLRFTISHYNRKAEEQVRELAEAEMERKHDLEAEAGETDEASSLSASERDERLAADIRSQTAVFLCIQTQSDAGWGLLHRLMGRITKLGLDIIDHRSWHPRGIHATLVNEIYVKDSIVVKERGSSQAVLEERMNEIKEALLEAINQGGDAKVRVQRWYPGVVEEIVENVDEKSKTTGKKSLSVEQRLLTEAATELDRKQNIQTSATKEKSVDEILAGMQAEPSLPVVEEGKALAPDTAAPTRRARRRRQKMRSTPVVGGGLFGETDDHLEEEGRDVQPGAAARQSGLDKWKPDFDFGPRGHKAEIIVQGESYNVRINDETLKALRTGYSGDMLDSHGVSVRGMSIEADSSDVVNQLQGYVRNVGGLSKIVEEEHEGESETSSLHGAASKEEPEPEVHLPEPEVHPM